MSERAVHPRRGFTLIEAVLSIVILAVAVPPVLWAVRHAHANRIDPVQTCRAYWLAVEKLEDVIADRHSTSRGYGYLLTANYRAEPSVAGYPGFAREVSLEETEADLSTPGSGYMKATVTVRWHDSRGVPRSLAVATVLTDYTP